MSEALAIAERALEHVSEDAEVFVGTERSGFARFAESEVHQPTLIENATVQLRLVRDGRAGQASTNRTDDDGLAALARRAAEVLASATEDPELPPLAPPAQFPEIEGYDEGTASLDAEQQAQLAAAAIAAGGELDLYGFFTSGMCEQAIASTSGLRATQRTTDATCRVLAAGEDASGFASATSWQAAAIDPAAVAEEAAAKAARTRGAGEATPERYRAVLEPYAVAELLYYFAFDTFNGLGMLEERSFFSGRIGDRAFDAKVTLLDDPLDPLGLPKAFDYEGVPKQRVVLAEEGVIRGAVWDRASAAQAGRASTGHGLPVEERAFGALPTALTLAPGTAESVDELAALVGDGLYITRLHYLGVVSPREGVITGMTRDGTFRIRDGRVAEPLVNLRFTVSVPDLLADVPGLTRETQLVNLSDFYDDRWAFGYRVPAIATACFNVTGAGSGPGL